MAYQSFEDLEVWKQGCQLAVRVHEALKGCQEFRLVSQMSASATSIPSNIADGAERGSNKDFIRFIHYSKGSAAELRTQLYIAIRLGIIEQEQGTELVDDTKVIAARLQALIRSLKT